jgi:hypothetical protein
MARPYSNRDKHQIISSSTNPERQIGNLTGRKTSKEGRIVPSADNENLWLWVRTAASQGSKGKRWIYLRHDWRTTSNYIELGHRTIGDYAEAVQTAAKLDKITDPHRGLYPDTVKATLKGSIVGGGLYPILGHSPLPVTMVCHHEAPAGQKADPLGTRVRCGSCSNALTMFLGYEPASIPEVAYGLLSNGWQIVRLGNNAICPDCLGTNTTYATVGEANEILSNHQHSITEPKTLKDLQDQLKQPVKVEMQGDVPVVIDNKPMATASNLDELIAKERASVRSERLPDERRQAIKQALATLNDQFDQLSTQARVTAAKIEEATIVMQLIEDLIDDE